MLDRTASIGGYGHKMSVLFIFDSGPKTWMEICVPPVPKMAGC